QVMIDTIPCGGDATLAPAQATLPKNQSEGDIPKIAIGMGVGDQLECFLRRVGIADPEFTNRAGSGRAQLYTLNGDTIPGATGAATDLWGNPTNLATYDLVLTPCDNGHMVSTVGPVDAPPPPPTPTPAQQANVKAYLESGGRLFATHWGSSD